MEIFCPCTGQGSGQICVHIHVCTEFIDVFLKLFRWFIGDITLGCLLSTRRRSRQGCCHCTQNITAASPRDWGSPRGRLWAGNTFQVRIGVSSFWILRRILVWLSWFSYIMRSGLSAQRFLHFLQVIVAEFGNWKSHTTNNTLSRQKLWCVEFEKSKRRAPK